MDQTLAPLTAYLNRWASRAQAAVMDFAEADDLSDLPTWADVVDVGSLPSETAKRRPWMDDEKALELRERARFVDRCDGELGCVRAAVAGAARAGEKLTVEAKITEIYDILQERRETWAFWDQEDTKVWDDALTTFLDRRTAELRAAADGCACPPGPDGSSCPPTCPSGTATV